MKVKTSSRPQRRLTKLSRQDDTGSKLFLDGEHVSNQHDLSTHKSYDRLSLSAEDREALRQELTSSIDLSEPASSKTVSITRWPSRDGLAMFGRKDKPTKAATVSVESLVEDPILSPSLSFHTAPRKMSTVAETQTIDIEAAINILQELKKTASPEELVALHRALLPVKEVDPVTPTDPHEHDHHLASEFRRQFASRRRSNMPPGLATRGGPTDDPLRRHGELQRKPVAQPKKPVDKDQRPFTPTDSLYGQAGVYRSGTLRITNGNASPASSMHFRESFEIQDATEVKLMHTRVASCEYKPVLDDEVKELPDEDVTEHELIDNTTLLAKLKVVTKDELIDSTTLLAKLEVDTTHEWPLASHEHDLPSVSDAMREYADFCGSPYDRKVSSRSESSGNESLEQFVTPKASMADFERDNQVALPDLKLALARPETVPHADSGYGSESSNSLPANASPVQHEESKTPTKLRTLAEQRWLTLSRPDSDTASARHSLYTLEQVMRSPSVLGHSQSSPVPDLATPSPSSTKNGKRQTLFSTLGLGRSRSSKDVSEIIDSEVSTPASVKQPLMDEDRPVKKAKTKKLKKATPHHIKQARKELKRLEEAALANAVTEKGSTITPIPEFGHTEEMVLQDMTSEPQQTDPRVYSQAMVNHTASQRRDCSSQYSMREQDILQSHTTQDVPRAYIAQEMPQKVTAQDIPDELTTRHIAQKHTTRDSAQKHTTRNVAQKHTTHGEAETFNNGTSDDTDDTSVIDFRAVARSLGASPYDISTSQFKASIDYISGSEDKWRIQSPFEIGQGIPGPRYLGMDEKAASELARKKSKDYVPPDSDHSPRPRGPRRPFGMAGKDLPPMPDLPEDVEDKATEDVDKKHNTDTSAVEKRIIHPQEPSAVDWDSQVKLWRERREALGEVLHKPQQYQNRTDFRSEDHQAIRQRTPVIANTKPLPTLTNTNAPLRLPDLLVSPVEVDPIQYTKEYHHIEVQSAESAQILSPFEANSTRNLLSNEAHSARTSSSNEAHSTRTLLPMEAHSTRTRSPMEAHSTRTMSPVSGVTTVSVPLGSRPLSRSSDTTERFPTDYAAKLNGIIPKQSQRMAPSPPVTTHPTPAPVMTRPKSACLMIPDRYSGGLEYEWHRDVGISGSAGTRTSMVEGLQRSRPTKMAWGLDMSDVPIFLTKKEGFSA